MKKLVSLLLAVVMILSLSAVVFAEDVTYAASDVKEGAFSIKKSYDSNTSFVPGETLQFTVEYMTGKTNPSDPMIVVGNDNTFTVPADTQSPFELEIPVTIPSYAVAGEYYFVIKEVAGNTAGVTKYDTTKTIEVGFVVEYDNTNHKLVITQESYIIKDSNGKKVDTFENEFKTGSFSVAKDVDGNLANENDKFMIQVTLTSTKEVLTDFMLKGDVYVTPGDWTRHTNDDGEFEYMTYTTVLELSEADGAVSFANVPYGVEVTVTELQAIDGENVLNGYTPDGYTINGERNSKATDANIVIDSDNQSVIVNNNKGTEIMTGVVLDSLPYILVLTIAVAGVAVLFAKKRHEN